MSASVATTDGITLSLQSLIDRRYDTLWFRERLQDTGSDFPGHRAGRKRGQGIEFLDLRQYTPGDDVRHIDWNVTARSNEPYTRLYRQEKELTTTVLVDLRPVMFNGSDRLRAVAAGHLAATALWQSAKQGDRCASIVIDSDKVRASRPLPGNKGVLPALELIATGFAASDEVIHRPQTHQGYTTPQLSDAFDIVNKNRHRSGHTIMFSGFDAKGDENFSNSLSALASHGKVTANLLLDRIEQQPLPRGIYRYRFAGRSKTISINKSAQEALAITLVEQRAQRLNQLNTAGINTLVINSTCSPVQFLGELQQRGWL